MSTEFDPNGESRVERGCSSKRRKSHLFTTPEANSLSDEELAVQLQAGQHDALTILFQRHASQVYGIARRMLHDAGEAEETLQQVFLDVYRAIQQFDAGRAPFKTWLLQFAYHRTINRKRHLESRGFYSSQEFAEEVLPVYASRAGILQLSSPELIYLVEQLLQTVEPRQRQTIELTFYEGLTAEEIAKKTGETPAVVRHNLYRGLDRLRDSLKERRNSGENVAEVEGIFLAYPRTL